MNSQKKCIGINACPSGPLQFDVNPDDYSDGLHTFTITATDQNEETDHYSFTFGNNITFQLPDFILSLSQTHHSQMFLKPLWRREKQLRLLV